MLKTITSDTNGTNPEINQCLDDLAREGAHRMIVAALELEVEEYPGHGIFGTSKGMRQQSATAKLESGPF